MNSAVVESGFTLLEVLVALAIFASVSALMAPAFVLHLKMNTAAEARVGAIAAAQQILDELRTVDPATLPSSGSAVLTVFTAEREYKVTAAYCQDASYCRNRTRHIRLDVAYRGNMVHTVETVYAKLK